MYQAKVICDSIFGNHRLTTMEVTFPRFILAEFNTHRALSRNSASSRAIPVAKQIEKVKANPVIPIFTKNQKGMQGEILDENTDEYLKAKSGWLEARDTAVKYAEWLMQDGIHKQNTNRLLEPFMWHTVIVTATEWANFFHLRANPEAQPEMQKIAKLMKEAYNSSTPTEKSFKDWWHLPYLQPEDEALQAGDKQAISVARCARVSYLTHDGKRDIDADLKLYERLKTSGHWSPFEHVARPQTPKDPEWMCSNFKGWVQLRKYMPNENVLQPLAT